jgi:hypothetical protein
LATIGSHTARASKIAKFCATQQTKADNHRDNAHDPGKLGQVRGQSTAQRSLAFALVIPIELRRIANHARRIWEMAFPPNYRQERSNRERAKQRKALEKQQKRAEKSLQRRDDNSAEPGTDPSNDTPGQGTED